MVQRDTQRQRMYLHDIIAEEATLSFNTEPTTQKSEVIRDEGHLFITGILPKVLSVNYVLLWKNVPPKKTSVKKTDVFYFFIQNSQRRQNAR